MSLDPRRHREILQSFIPKGFAEQRHKLRMLALMDDGLDAFARDHFHPGHFTSSAFVMSPQWDRLLMILHGKLGRWLQPGGHIENDDVDLPMAAMREVCEETGLHPSSLQLIKPGVFDVDVHDIPARGSEPAHEHFDVRFLFHAKDDTVALGDEVDDVRWVPLDEVERLEADDSVLRAVRRLRETV